MQKHTVEKQKVSQSDLEKAISVENIYGAFHPIIRFILKLWNRKLTKVAQNTETQTTIAHLNEHLKKGNAIIFFDHHYAFDALPVGLTLGELLKNAKKALIPYAIHLDLGVDGTGTPSRRYKIRTRLFKWLISKVQKSNPNIRIMPVARKFEISNDNMKSLMGNEYRISNVDYQKTFINSFKENENGFVCILSPIAGLAFPHKPILHTRMYALLENLQKELPYQLPFFYVSAYPRLKKKWHYHYPMLARHDFFARDSFHLPHDNYEAANSLMKSKVTQLRKDANFELLDYEVIKNK